jgi:hypothetical protein
MHDKLFQEIDRLWGDSSTGNIRLHVLGSGALMMQVDYRRPTNDGDVFETLELTPAIRDRLKKLAGRDTELHIRLGMYLDIVANGIPFLAHVPTWRPQHALNATLQHFEISALDVVDVVVSKLKRFNARDRSDIDAMVQRDLVDHDLMLERFESAKDIFAHDARADDLPAIVMNLHTVERDMLQVPESDIELPSWI